MRRGRVAAGEARHQDAPVLTKAAYWPECRQRPDRHRIAHSQGGRRRRRGRLLAGSDHRRGGLAHRRWWVRPGQRVRRGRQAPSRRGDHCAAAVPSDTAATAPTQRDRHLQHVEPKGSPDIAKHGRMAWRKASGYTTRARAEAAIGRFKQVIGDVRRTSGFDVLRSRGRAPRGRGGRRRPRAQSHDGAWTPELRPYRSTSNRVGATAPALQVDATSVDAPFWARENFRMVVARGRMLSSVRPLVQRWTAAGLYGSSRTGSKSRSRTRSTVLQPGCPDPVSPTVAPCLPSARPTPSRL